MKGELVYTFYFDMFTREYGEVSQMPCRYNNTNCISKLWPFNCFPRDFFTGILLNSPVITLPVLNWLKRRLQCSYGKGENKVSKCISAESKGREWQVSLCLLNHTNYFLSFPIPLLMLVRLGDGTGAPSAQQDNKAGLLAEEQCRDSPECLLPRRTEPGSLMIISH